MNKLRAHCFSLLALGIFGVMAAGSMDSPSDTSSSASKPSSETQTPPDPLTAVSACDPSQAKRHTPDSCERTTTGISFMRNMDGLAVSGWLLGTTA